MTSPATFRAFLAVALLVWAASCRRGGDDRCGDAVAVARAFVAATEAHDSEAILGLLSTSARERLEREAETASGVLGQKVTAADLLVPERSVLARPEWLELRSVSGDRAIVEVRAPDDAGAEADGPWGMQVLVREDGCWRVDLFEGVPAGEPAAAADADPAP